MWRDGCDGSERHVWTVRREGDARLGTRHAQTVDAPAVQHCGAQVGRLERLGVGAEREGRVGGV